MSSLSVVSEVHRLSKGGTVERAAPETCCSVYYGVPEGGYVAPKAQPSLER